MKHFGIYESREDIHSALNDGRLENPYVALVDGELDYNYLEPEEPCYLGEWSYDGQDTYTFQILDTGDTAWESGPNIGSLADVYFNGGGPIDMDVKLDTMPGSGEWHMTFVDPEESASPSHTFEEGGQDTWSCEDVMTEPDQSTGYVWVSFNGTDAFTFAAGTQYPLSMDTINPECSE